MDNRNHLQSIRFEISEKMPKNWESYAEIQAILEITTSKMKTFSAHLLEQAMKYLGEAPCKYAMVGFGSLARGEMTPYSDLEFAFLVENEKQVPFFRDLTYLLHFKVLCLGETILPALGISLLSEFTDCITSRGFAFDGAGVIGKGHKTPLGFPGSFELIHTPKEMAAFQGKKAGSEQYWFEVERFLPMELQQYTWIVGNDDARLTRDYENELEEVLKQPCEETTLRSYMAQKLLVQEDLDTFSPLMFVGGNIVNVKKELYRLPHLFLQRLCLFHRIKEETSWKKIDALESKKVIQPKVAERFRELFAITMWYRFSTYMQYQAQNESRNPLLTQIQSENLSQPQQQLGNGIQDFSQLIHLYSILLPLTEMMDHFNKGIILDENDSFDCSNKTLGEIAFRLMQFQKAKEYYSLAVQEHPDDLFISLCLARTLVNLLELQDALDRINSVLRIFEGMEREKIDYEVAGYYMMCGQIYHLMGRTNDALAAYQQIIEKYEPISTDLLPNEEKLSTYKSKIHLHDEILRYRLNSELGQIYFEVKHPQEAKKHFLSAIKIAQKSLLSRFPELNAEVLTNQGMIGLIQKDYDHAEHCFKHVLTLNRQIFSDSHPQNLTCLQNLCQVYRLKRDYRSSIALFNYCITNAHAFLDFPGSNSSVSTPVGASAFLRGLGGTYLEWGDEKKSQYLDCEAKKKYRKAINLLEQASKLDKQILDITYVDLVEDLLLLARAYESIEDYEKSISLYLKAIKILRVSPSDNPSQLSEALTFLGLSIMSKADQKKDQDVEMLEKRALICFEYACELRKEYFPSYSDKLIKNLILLVITYLRVEKLVKAKKTYHLTLKEIVKMPQNHPVVVWAKEILQKYEHLLVDPAQITSVQANLLAMEIRNFIRPLLQWINAFRPKNQINMWKKRKLSLL